MSAGRFEVTTSSYVRSHGREPKGRGGWAFQRTYNYTAYERELYGEVIFAPGALTFTEAKRWLREQHGAGLWAALS